MLRGISSLFSPDLLKFLYEMGHGDEILLADAHFPGHSIGQRVLRADGLKITGLLDAILPLLELDKANNPLAMMEPTDGDRIDPEILDSYMSTIRRHVPEAVAPIALERSAFYQRARTAFVVVVTGDVAAYGNIFLKKGLTPSGQKCTEEK
jgi:L-fucose mutarotase